MNKKKRPSKWLWATSAILLVSLTGCGMYPTKPGVWPNNFWGTILHYASDVIDFFARIAGNDYGIALLIVTIIVRLLILPLFMKQIKYQRAMMQLQPKISKLRNQYKGDPQKLQEATMALYKEHGVNPLAGCFPTVVQLPFLYALYGAIMGNAGLHKAHFLHIFNLGQPDHHFILPVIAALTTYLSSRLMMAGQDQQQKMLLFVSPVIVLVIGARLPSGLALYWIYGNIFMAVQAYFTRIRPARKLVE